MMNHSSSKPTDAGSPSPETPGIGVPSSLQPVQSLEVHMACDDQQDPVASLVTDSATSRRNSISLEFREVHALDGRAITLVNAKTQTDWEWLEQKLTDSCQVQSEIEEPKPVEALQTDLMRMVTRPDTELLWKNEDTEMEKTQDNELYGIPAVGPPSLLAYKPESKQPPVHLEKVPVVSTAGSSREQREQETKRVLCDYCQQPSKPFISWEELENNLDLKLVFCCEWALKMREFLLEEERILTAAEANRKIDVGPHPPFMGRQEKSAAKERSVQRLREWKIQRVQNTGNQNRFFSGVPQIKTISYRLSNEVWTIRKEAHFPQLDITDASDFFTLQGETDAGHRRNHVVMRLYPNGKPFITLFPDGTGNVFFPSGNTAIIISSAEAGDFTYLIMEDKDVEPQTLAIFTTRSQSTCYHPNGHIWVNLTPLGGTCCSETGALRRRWNWLDLEPHIHVPPFQPICLALNAQISLRIQTQERIYLTYSSRQNRARFNVGSRLKLTHPEGLVMLGPDILQKHLQMKSLEIYSLLDRIQTCMAYQHSTNPHNIKPQYSLIAQMQRLGRQMGKPRSPQKT